MPKGIDWTTEENKLVVASYLAMLAQQLDGVIFVKAHEVRRLQASGLDRSVGSIEYKFQNISAVLAENDWIRLKGYKPARNFQRSLLEEVLRQLNDDEQLKGRIQDGLSGGTTL